MAKKPTYVRLGSVLRKKDKNGSFIVTGNTYGEEKYHYTVELTVKDSRGKVIAQATNPLISVQDPRKKPGLSEEQVEKIPQALMAELTLRVE